MADNTTLARVRRLVAKPAGQPPEELAPATRLRDDLGIDGDDAEMLLINFAAEFGLDGARLTGVLQRYFVDEWTVTMQLWRRLLRRPAPLRQPLTVADLVAVADGGAWPTRPVASA